MLGPLGLSTVVAHRGASAAAPENTLAAFRAADAEGARWIEFDVRLTGCGALVVLHDARLERTTNGRGRVRGVPLAALQAADAGAWFAAEFAGERVPTLEAVLDLASALDLGCNVEIKAESDDEARVAARAVAGSFVGAGCPVLVSSFSRAALQALRAAAPAAAIGLLVGRRVSRGDLAFATAVGAVSLHADRRAFTATTTARLREAGLWPVAYTVNDAQEAVRLHRHDGVGTIITDRPAAILAALAHSRIASD